jgi:lipid II:glycine glycyltransferase (peptidoglycan interpeptide bridge formation enzyme)
MAEEVPISLRCLHNELPLADETFATLKRARWHGVDVQPDLDTLWHGLHDSSKRAIQKARRSGVSVQPAESMDELRVFHDMHVMLRKHKYQLLAQPYSFFENIWRNFIDRDAGALLLASHRGQIIGGVMLLQWRETMYYKFNASVPDELEYRPNDLLMWEAMTFAKTRRARSLDLGLSDWDQTGLIQYKRKFASEEKVISSLQYAPDVEQLERQQALRGVVAALTTTFAGPAVSDDVSRAAGELMYRYLA